MPERVLPRDNFDTPPEFLIPLSNAELQELGTFTAIWSQIDWIILLIICDLAKVEIGYAQLMMESMTTRRRFNLLVKLCQDGTKTPVKISIEQLCEDNDGLIEDRNHIMNGLWAIKWDYLSGEATPACLDQKGKREPIFAEELPKISNRAAKMSNMLGALLERLDPTFVRGPTPRPFFFGDGDRGGRGLPPWPPAHSPQCV